MLHGVGDFLSLATALQIFPDLFGSFGYISYICSVNISKKYGIVMRFGLSDTVIKELQDVFRRHANIEKVLIFGSRSKGNFRAGSDITKSPSVL